MRISLRGAWLTVFVLAGGSTVMLGQPQISVTPESHDYGEVDVGGSSNRTFIVRNTGSSDLTGTASLNNGIHFAISSGGGDFTLSPGGTREVVVAFTPVRSGEQFDSLLVVHDAENEPSPVRASLSGTGVPRPAIEVVPTSHNFGEVAVESAVSFAFYVKNIGSGTMHSHVGITSGAPHYRVTTTLDKFTVAGGDSAAVIVEFAPTFVTSLVGVLEVEHNGTNVPSPIIVVLAGEGIPKVSLDPTEPNDNADSAFVISAGFVSSGTEIFPEGDVDFFRFDGVFGEEISIEAENLLGSPLNGKLRLFDSDGNLLAENDDDGSSDRSRIDYSVRATGPYFIRYAFAGNDGGLSNLAQSKTLGDQPTGKYQLSLTRTGLTPLGIPELVTPDEGLVNEHLNPLLIWRAVEGAKTYDAIIATSANFEPSSVVFQTSRTDTTVTAGSLSAGTVHFWRVRAGNELGPGQFSGSRSFATSFAPVVVAAIPDVEVPEGTQTVSLAGVFDDPEGGELTYDVVGLSDSTVASVIVEDTELLITATGSGRTAVSVAAEDPQGARTTDAFFVVAGAATSSSQDDLPVEGFGLGTNYPNPFSTQTTIPFSLAEPSNVKLSVFDLLGKSILTLTDRPFPSGRHEFDFTSDGLTPGVYLLRIEAGSNAASRSFVVTP